MWIKRRFFVYPSLTKQKNAKSLGSTLFYTHNKHLACILPKISKCLHNHWSYGRAFSRSAPTPRSELSSLHSEVDPHLLLGDLG